MTFTTAQPRFQSFFGGRFFSQNWHFGIKKRITKHNFLVLQSTNLYLISNEDHTFEKKNVSFLLVTSTLTYVKLSKGPYNLQINPTRHLKGTYMAIKMVPNNVSREIIYMINNHRKR